MFWKKKTPEDEKASEFRERLKDENVDKRLSTIAGLAEVGSTSPEIFPPLLKDRDARVRTSAAFALSSLISTSPELRGDLVKQAVEFFMHKDLRMQYYAAGLLGRVADSFPEALRDSMPRIMNLLGEKEFAFYIRPRAFAVGDIGSAAPQLVEELLPEIAGLLKEQIQVVITLERISARHPLLLKDYVPQLVEVVKNVSEKTLSLCWDAAVVLVRISTSSPELGQLVRTHMESLLEEGKVLARGFAAFVIGEIGLRNPELIADLLPRLTELLEDEPDVRWFAALALGRISSRSPASAEKVTPELMKMVKDPEPLVRGAVVVSLRYIALASPEIVKDVMPSLSEMLKDKHPTIRGIAAIGLKLISMVSPDIVSDVVETVSDMSWETNADARRGAATAFHHISRCYEPETDRQLIPQIVELLDDTEVRIRDRAAMAVKNIAAARPDDVKEWIPKAVELLEDKAAIIRRDAAYALREFSATYPELVKEAALHKLLELLEEGDPNVHTFAALALGKLM